MAVQLANNFTHIRSGGTSPEWRSQSLSSSRVLLRGRNICRPACRVTLPPLARGHPATLSCSLHPPPSPSPSPSPSRPVVDSVHEVGLTDNFLSRIESSFWVAVFVASRTVKSVERTVKGAIAHTTLSDVKAIARAAPNVIQENPPAGLLEASPTPALVAGLGSSTQSDQESSGDSSLQLRGSIQGAFCNRAIVAESGMSVLDLENSPPGRATVQGSRQVPVPQGASASSTAFGTQGSPGVHLGWAKNSVGVALAEALLEESLSTSRYGVHSFDQYIPQIASPVGGAESPLQQKKKPNLRKSWVELSPEQQKGALAEFLGQATMNEVTTALKKSRGKLQRVLDNFRELSGLITDDSSLRKVVKMRPEILAKRSPDFQNMLSKVKIVSFQLSVSVLTVFADTPWSALQKKSAGAMEDRIKRLKAAGAFIRLSKDFAAPVGSCYCLSTVLAWTEDAFTETLKTLERKGSRVDVSVKLSVIRASCTFLLSLVLPALSGQSADIPACF